jgi:hypothetical protein
MHFDACSNARAVSNRKLLRFTYYRSSQLLNPYTQAQKKSCGNAKNSYSLISNYDFLKDNLKRKTAKP